VDLNTKGRYAVMAMADIANHAECDAVPLSPNRGSPAPSRWPISSRSRSVAAGWFVESVRGRTGGYRLGRPATQITVAEVMAAVEEEVRMTRCAGEGNAPCLGTERCLTHGLWMRWANRLNISWHA